jgi:hypothetical protein
MADRLAFGRCPLCGKQARHETRPFCSRRCANIDLGRWLGERYVVSRPDPDAEADGPPGANGSDEPGSDGRNVGGGI